MERLKEIFEKVYELYPYTGVLAFLDLETTGFKNEDKIIELGCIRIRFNGMEVEFDTFESLINPGVLVSQVITDITGITNDELALAPTEDEVYPKFIEWYNKDIPSILGAHNASFDKRLLKANLSRIGHASLACSLPDFSCTMQMSRKKLIGPNSPKNDQLKTILEYYGFINKQAHRALSDTEGCAYIWAKMTLGEFDAIQ